MMAVLCCVRDGLHGDWSQLVTATTRTRHLRSYDTTARGLTRFYLRHGRSTTTRKGIFHAMNLFTAGQLGIRRHEMIANKYGSTKRTKDSNFVPNPADPIFFVQRCCLDRNFVPCHLLQIIF